MLIVQGEPLNRSRLATVVCVSSIVTLDRSLLRERSGRLSARQLGLVLAGIDLVLGR